MSELRVGVLATTMVVALSGVALAQFPPPPGPSQQRPAPAVQDRWPDPSRPPPPDTKPVGIPDQQPAQRPRRRPAPTAEAKPEQDIDPAAQKPKPPPAPANVVACNGVFAKDSGHLKLAIKYDSRNITYGQVDGPEGSKINASILFPNDPRRRLEVLWANEAARSETSIIAINGRSQWVAPKGLKLGLPLAALEKLNGKPFKLSGFGADGGSSVTGWEGGGLASLPGGCKVGMRLVADSKASQEARSAVTGDKELLSNDPNVRAVKPTIAEILIGY